MFSPVEEPESLTASTTMDMEPLKRSVIQFAPPTYVLFPGDDPFDDLNRISTPRYPYLPDPPGFTLIDRQDDIPWLAGWGSLAP